jgi:hypothetical protein
MSDSYRDGGSNSLRVLFCIGVMPSTFEVEREVQLQVIGAIKEAFSDLRGRFGLRVLGTMDDDELMVGPSTAFPWTSYILADAPNLEAVAAVTNLLRETKVPGGQLWRYLRIEARVGRELFFGNE